MGFHLFIYNFLLHFCLRRFIHVKSELMPRNQSPNFLTLGASGINSTESIPCNLSPLSEVIEQVTPQQRPLNVIYILVLRGHCSIWSGVNICSKFHTWFLLNSWNGSFLLNPSKKFVSEGDASYQEHLFRIIFGIFEVARIFPSGFSYLSFIHTLCSVSSRAGDCGGERLFLRHTPLQQEWAEPAQPGSLGTAPAPPSLLM